MGINLYFQIGFFSDFSERRDNFSIPAILFNNATRVWEKVD